MEGVSGRRGTGGGGFREHAFDAHRSAGHRLFHAARTRRRDRRRATAALNLERDALAFITSRHDLGFATGLDLAQQQALVRAARRNWSCCKFSARRIEHAIATLVGTPAPALASRASSSAGRLAGDTGGSALRFVAAPARRGFRGACDGGGERAYRVARAAYFPTIHLSPLVPSLGWESTAVASLFKAPSQLWSSGFRPRRRCSTPGAPAPTCVSPNRLHSRGSRPTARPC